jgi:hypothetical protein
MELIRIIFLEGENADEALDVYKNHGSEGALQFLDQWFDGDIKNYEVFNEPAAGSSDRVYEISDYLLTVNTGLNYIGLELITKRDPPYNPEFLSGCTSFEEEVRELSQWILSVPGAL